MAWSLIILKAIVLSTVSLISLICVSYIIAGWLLRNDFEMAVRSPLLLTMSGTAGVCIAYWTVFQVLLIDASGPGMPQLFLIPLKVTVSTSAYIMRGTRLLVMYNPSFRKRSGPYIKEATMAKVLMIAFGFLEALVWPLSLVFGVRRVASFTMIVVLLDALLTLGATLVLVAKLRTTTDLFDMSSEIQSVGACLLGHLALIAMYFLVPASFQAFTTITAMFVRYFATMWISNIQPLRALLSRRVVGADDSVPWFPYMPLWSPSTRIVVGYGHSTVSRATRAVKGSGTDDGWLDTIMACPSLLRDFKEYCRKALCSELLFFLIEVSEFGGCLEEAPADSGKAVHFQRFQAAVEKYVKDGAPFEINISSKTKAAVLKVAKIKSFQHLTLEEISQVLVPAAQEANKMLKENIYDKFRITEEYRRVARSLEGMAPDG